MPIRDNEIQGKPSAKEDSIITIDVHRPAAYSRGPAARRRGGDIRASKGGKMRIADHPGQVLAYKLEAIGISPTELARQLLVPPNRITQIINGKRGITSDSALRLAHWFGNAPEFWMNLQVQHDLKEAAKELGTQIMALPTGPARRSGRLPKQAQAE